VSELVGNVEAVRTEVSRGRETSAALRRAPPAERADLLTTYLRAEAARTLGMSQQELDPATPLSSFGFDSLMAVQLKNQIEKDLRVVVPMIRFLDGPSLSELVPSVLKAMSSEPVELPVASSSPGEPWEEGSI
jgi:acyl carrier protein